MEEKKVELASEFPDVTAFIKKVLGDGSAEGSFWRGGGVMEFMKMDKSDLHSPVPTGFEAMDFPEDLFNHANIPFESKVTEGSQLKSFIYTVEIQKYWPLNGANLVAQEDFVGFGYSKKVFPAIVDKDGKLPIVGGKPSFEIDEEKGELH